jgi:hypothetical protein
MKISNGAVERGVLFSDEMVRAFLRGDKLQTRRPIVPQPEFTQFHEWQGRTVYDGEGRAWCWRNHVIDGCCNSGSMQAALVEVAPMRVGDRVYARETFRAYCTAGNGDYYRVEYRAGGGPRDLMIGAEITADDTDRSWKILRRTPGGVGGWWPSIHMPKWAARLWFEVTGVRVERVQSITEDDALAEGVSLPECAYVGRCNSNRCGLHRLDAHRHAFRLLWDSIYAAQGLGWDANPWVWVYDLRRVDAAWDGSPADVALDDLFHRAGERAREGRT